MTERARRLKLAAPEFSDATDMFDRAWYGDEPTGAGEDDRFRSLADSVMAKATAGTRQQIAFYGSTPAYRGVLEHHGWGDLQPDLNRLSKEGKWVEMGGLIDDEILHTFAVVGAPDAERGMIVKASLNSCFPASM